MKTEDDDVRSVAVEVLAAVERGGRSDRLLDAALRSRTMSERDRRLATEIVYGTLRREATLDRTLEPHCTRPLERLDREVLVALRIAVYQAGYLSSVPSHAAVDSSVEIVKTRRPAAAGLVNAVLRGWTRVGGKLEGGRPGVLGDALDVPAWWYERWRHAYGAAATAAWFREALKPSSFFLHPHRRVADPVELVNELGDAGVVVVPSGEGAGVGLRVEQGNPLNTDAFRRGAFTPRSEAARLVTRLLPVHEGDLVLDACSGRGGKAVQLVEEGRPRLVVGVDNAARRLADGRLAARRARAHEVAPVLADLASGVPTLPSFDAILVDAPCSGLGTVRRNPEIKWRVRPRDLASFAQVQLRILTACLGALAPGGRLLYVTCSTEPEENEDVVRAALGEPCASDIGIVAASLDTATEGFHRGDDGFFRTYPNRPDLDGFFAALVVRSGPESATAP